MYTVNLFFSCNLSELLKKLVFQVEFLQGRNRCQWVLKSRTNLGVVVK